MVNQYMLAWKRHSKDEKPYLIDIEFVKNYLVSVDKIDGSLVFVDKRSSSCIKVHKRNFRNLYKIETENRKFYVDNVDQFLSGFWR